MKKIFVTIICFTICIFTVSAINNEFRLDVNKILKDSSRTTAIADKMNTSYKIDYKVNKEENNEEYINLTKKTTFLLLGDGNISDETAYNYIQRKTEYGSLRYDPEIPKDENSFSGYDEDSKEYSDSLVAGITVPGMFNMLNSMNIYYDYLGDVKIIKQEDGFLSRIVLEGVKIDFSDPENPRKFKTEDTNLIIYYIFKEYKGEYKLYYLMAETNDTLDEYLEQVSKNENNNILSSKIPNISDISKLYDYSKLSSLTNKDLTNIYNTNINKTMLLSTYYDKSIITSATGFMLTNDILVTSWNYLKESLINGQFILIKDKNGNVYELEGVLTFDEVSEIALLKIKGYKGEGVTLGDSNLNKEDAVIALTTSTGMGITSQTGIVVNTSDYIQSLIPIKDTGIGSPLINAKGEVVGMNNSKALNSVISYATKVDCLKKIKEELMKTPNVKVTSFDKLKEEYYYQRSNTEKQKNNIPSKVWNEYKKIGNIEDNIFLPLIKASYKENVLSLRYKNEINNFMNSNNFSSLFEKALKEEKYNLIFDSNTKRIYENNKYKVVIMNEFDYLIVVMVKK